MDKHETYIWQTLTHDSILNTVEQAIGCKLTNLFLKRNSYINRVYELEKAETKERIIVKFYRPGRWTPAMIKEEHAFVLELQAQDIPVIPPLTINNQTLFFFGEIPYAIYPKKGGRAIDEFDKEGWLNIGRMLAKLHIVGAKHPHPKRLIWTPEQATRHHAEVLLRGRYINEVYQQAFQNILEIFIKQAEQLFVSEEKILLHGDLHKGNLIHRPGEGIFIVDFDDICVGSPVQDMWMLLPGVVDESEQELAWFQEGYETFRDFSEKSLRIIPALRAMRIVHFAAWCAAQSAEPDFAEHFPEWGTPKYWSGIIKEIQEITYTLK